MWTYATCCMSQQKDGKSLELHIFSPKQDASIVELLTATAHYHRIAKNLGLNHTVNFGRPWQDDSMCNHGFISLPYLDGPQLENMLYHKKKVNFYWLIPITASELEFVKLNGAEALEEQFESKNFNYMDSNRPSVL